MEETDPMLFMWSRPVFPATAFLIDLASWDGQLTVSRKPGSS
jgi:hypothetical protein